MKKLLLTLASLIAVLVPGLLPATVYAAPTAASQALCEGADDGSGTADCTGDTSGQTVSNIIKVAIRLFQGIVGILAVFYITMGGLGYITSSGDASKAKTARERIIYAMVGLIIVGIAEILVRFALNRAYNL